MNINTNTITKEINDCTITITFSAIGEANLKSNILWYLTQCYESRLESEIKRTSE